MNKKSNKQKILVMTQIETTKVRKDVISPFYSVSICTKHMRKDGPKHLPIHRVGNHSEHRRVVRLSDSFTDYMYVVVTANPSSDNLPHSASKKNR